ncbi:hypothetical protein C0992_007953, partial [Termitomyces sp. T32_za158]
VHDFVQADKHIDPDGEDLPLHRFQEIAERHVEIRAMQAHAVRRSTRLKEQLEVRDLKAQSLAGAEPAIMRPMEEPLSNDDDLTVKQVLGIADPSPRTADLKDAQLCACIQRGYSHDKFYVEILDKPLEHPCFVIEQKLIYMMSPAGVKVVCVLWDRSLITTILDQAHHIVGHFGYQKTLEYNALTNLANAHDAIIEAHVFQTRHANNRRGDELAIDKGSLVYLSTKNLNLPKGQASKLCPKWVGPYKVLEAEPSTSNYVLELPTALQAQRIMPKFHVSLLQPYAASNDVLFPNRATPEPYDFGMANDQEWFVDDLIGHCWTQSGNLKFEVRWSLGDTTWEPLENCKSLATMDRYLELQGVKRPRQLAR